MVWYEYSENLREVLELKGSIDVCSASIFQVEFTTAFT
jgi:hypothetical protein